jgi:putative endonuclease
MGRGEIIGRSCSALQGANIGENKRVKNSKHSATSSAAPPAELPWLLYLLECESGAYYAGITTDLDRRFAQHVFGIGARYTRANPPTCVLAVMEFADRSSASRAEAALKKLPRGKKLDYFRC